MHMNAFSSLFGFPLRRQSLLLLLIFPNKRERREEKMWIIQLWKNFLDATFPSSSFSSTFFLFFSFLIFPSSFSAPFERPESLLSVPLSIERRAIGPRIADLWFIIVRARSSNGDWSLLLRSRIEPPVCPSRQITSHRFFALLHLLRRSDARRSGKQIRVKWMNANARWALSVRFGAIAIVRLGPFLYRWIRCQSRGPATAEPFAPEKRRKNAEAKTRTIIIVHRGDDGDANENGVSLPRLVRSHEQQLPAVIYNGHGWFRVWLNDCDACEKRRIDARARANAYNFVFRVCFFFFFSFSGVCCLCSDNKASEKSETFNTSI